MLSSTAVPGELPSCFELVDDKPPVLVAFWLSSVAVGVESSPLVTSASVGSSGSLLLPSDLPRLE
ncbi:hypothetical protein EV182_006744, partial [Spiromyces aspiralis]